MKILIDKDNKVTNIYNGDGEKQGWIEIDSIQEPEEKEGFIPIMYYRNGQIVYEYEKIPEAPIEEEILIPTVSYKEQVQNKIHEVYSLDDENAILRKEIARLGNYSEEFKAYNDYAEQCKQDVKKSMSNE